MPKGGASLAECRRENFDFAMKQVDGAATQKIVLDIRN
jgi:hypothetical protein